jgi:hypothetical protein
MNHRYADCQNADPDDLGDCACMGTRSDLVREILDAEATIKRLEEERDEKIAMDADMAGAGCGKCRSLRAERDLWRAEWEGITETAHVLKAEVSRLKSEALHNAMAWEQSAIEYEAQIARLNEVVDSLVVPNTWRLADGSEVGIPEGTFVVSGIAAALDQSTES